MTDKFKDYATGRSDPANDHFAITPSNTADLPQRPRVLYCVSSGTIVLVGASGVELTYSLQAGQILPFSPVRIKATGTTATVYGWV